MNTPLPRLYRNMPFPIGFLMIAVSILSSGCFQHYYSTNSSSHIDSVAMMKLVHEQKYFIVHDFHQKTAFNISNLKVSNGQLEADVVPLPSEHMAYVNPAQPDHNKFPVKYQDVVLYEVHLYSQTPIKDSGHLNIPLKDFDRIDVYRLDKKSTNKSRAGSIVGITFTTAAVAGLIVAIGLSDWEK